MRHRALTRTARAATVGLVLLVVAATSACNPGRPPAATVGGTDISAERVDQMLAAFVEGAPDIYRSSIEGQGDGTTQMGAASAILNSLVLQVLQAELADDAGVVPGADDIDEATSLVQASFVSGAAQPDDPEPQPEATAALEQSTAIYDAMPGDLQDWLVDLRATTLALARHASTQVSTGEPSDADQLCLRAIVVETTDLPAVQDRLAAGEDFGQVSAQVSIDQQLAAAEGSLGQDCLTADGYLQGGLIPEVVEAVRDLGAGAVSDPLDLGQGVSALFEVTERRPDSDAALGLLVQQSLADIDVRVDPRFGRWDAETGSITPPDGSRVPGDLVVEDPLAPAAG